MTDSLLYGPGVRPGRACGRRTKADYSTFGAGRESESRQLADILD
jgi:hypothetical protein